MQESINNMSDSEALPQDSLTNTDTPRKAGEPRIKHKGFVQAGSSNQILWHTVIEQKGFPSDKKHMKHDFLQSRHVSIDMRVGLISYIVFQRS